MRSLILIILLSLQANAFAEAEESWHFSATPYLWVTGQEGEVATLPSIPPAELDISFNDIISNLDMTLMGLVEARKARIGFFGEIFYVGVSTDADTPGPAFPGADYEQDLWGVSLGASYALTQSSTGHLDALAGFRLWDLDNDLKLRPGSLPSREISGQESWNDFFVGLKGRTSLNERWFLSGWGMLAVAGDSDSSWDLFGGVGYEFSDTLSLDIGYRHQVIDYENGDFLYDVELSGPIIGLIIQF